MKNLLSITLSILLLTVLSDDFLQAQKKYSYLVELDSLLDVSNYRQPSGYFDLGRIKLLPIDDLSRQPPRFVNFRKFLLEANAVSVRKLIRRLPDNASTLKTRRGQEYSVEHFQKRFVIETLTPLSEIEIENLKKSKIIKAFDRNRLITVDAWPPNDPRYQEQRQFYNTSYNINLPRAWQYTSGNSGIKVAIVDHGVDYRHSDFGSGFGVGYRVRGGWDWKDNDSDPLPDVSNDVIENHGTPVAGIIAALNNNGVGGVGIAGGWTTVESGCQLFSFRVSTDELDNNGRRMIDRALVTEAVFEAATDPSVNNGYGYGVHAINCSFGGESPTYWNWSTLSAQSNYDAYVWAYLNNVVVVASRGNEGNSEPRYPANFSNGDVLISVSGVSDNGSIHGSSSYGDGVTLSAPWYIDLTTKNNNAYSGFSGTSNAAPFVTGVAALVKSKFRERGFPVYAEDVREILKITAQSTSDPTRYGAGRLDAGQALYLSSQVFGLQHVTATKNRTVTTVPNPSGDVLSLYYPFGTYIVQQTRKIVASVDVPNDFVADSAWVWANSYSQGLKWGNPSYGMQGASFVVRNGREYTFQMFVYELRDLAGNYLGWYPYHPNTANINVSILGRYAPLSVSISGPTEVYHPEKGYPANSYTWTANVIGGLPLRSVIWFKTQLGSTNQVGTGTSYSEAFSYDGAGGGVTQFVLRADVTDASSPAQFASASITVNEYHSGAGSAKMVENTGQQISAPPEYFGIAQNYPNPFNPDTEIAFTLPEPSVVQLTILDILGREVITLANGSLSAGYHRVRWNGRDARGGIFGSGQYFYRIDAVGQSGQTFSKTMKMVLLK